MKRCLFVYTFTVQMVDTRVNFCKRSSRFIRYGCIVLDKLGARHLSLELLVFSITDHNTGFRRYLAACSRARCNRFITTRHHFLKLLKCFNYFLTSEILLKLDPESKHLNDYDAKH